MALSEESRTLLQLLLGRGKNYSDIAGLLGIEETEVRRRAHQALTEINGSDPDRDLNLTDYLLGQSDPIARADAARELADNESAGETASSLADQLRLLVPGAELPRIPGSHTTASGAATKAKPASAARLSGLKPSKSSRPAETAGSDDPSGPGRGDASGSLTGSQRRLIAILLFAALLVTVLILLLTGVIGGDSDDSPDQSPASPEAATSVLQPTGGQKGTGKVELGQSDQQFAARMQFSDLKPTAKDESYILWAVGSIGAFPLNESQVKKDGNLGETIVLPSVIFCSIATDVFPEFRLTRLTPGQRQDVLNQTKQAADGKQNKLPQLTGKTVFKGPVVMAQDLKDSIGASCQTAAAGDTTGATNQTGQ